jgi:carboxyl-terminal processing protease
LDDLHIWIEAGGETIGTSTRGWRPAWNASVVSQQLTGLQVFGDLARFASVRDSDFAYLEVTALQATPAEIDALLAAMGQGRDAPGFIVDIRRCFGGSEPIAQRIAQFFCGREIVYAKNKYRHGPRHHQFGEELSRTLSPAKDPYTRPVVCLISNGTMSSGESFAQMLDALPQVVTVGEHTRGSSGNPAPFTLPGLDVKVWYSRWFDMGPDGSVVERAGVVPDILIDQPPEAYQDADPIFTRAIEVLRSRLGAD